MGPLPDIPPWVYTLFFMLRQKHGVQKKNQAEDGSNTVQPADDCVPGTDSDKVLDGQMSMLADILAELKWQRSGFEKKAEEIQVQDKWKEVAGIINRGFGYVFISVFILLIITCSVLWAQT